MPAWRWVFYLNIPIALVVLVVILFLLTWRASIIPLIAVPVFAHELAHTLGLEHHGQARGGHGRQDGRGILLRRHDHLERGFEVAVAAPEGEMTWAVHVSLAPTWFDPAEAPGVTGAGWFALCTVGYVLTAPLGEVGPGPGWVVPLARIGLVVPFVLGQKLVDQCGAALVRLGHGRRLVLDAHGR